MSDPHNTFDMNTKQLLIYPVGMEDSAIELGCTSWEKRMQNDLSDFAKPSTDSDAERRAQNLNQISENHVFNSVVSDEFVVKSEVNDEVGGVAGFIEPVELTSKEQIDAQLTNYFKLNRRVTVEYGHIEATGYLTEYNVEEAAQQDNSIYRIDFALLVSVPMSGSD